MELTKNQIDAWAIEAAENSELGALCSMARAWVVAHEVTPEMIEAGIDADDKRTGGQTCKHIYLAMISAVTKDTP